VSDFSLLSCVTACCVVERFDLTIIKAAYYYYYDEDDDDYNSCNTILS